MSTEETTPEWHLQLIAALVPDTAERAAKVNVDLSIDANTDYEGEPDQSTSIYLRATVTGYDETHGYLWGYDRVYEGSAAAVALLNDLTKQEIR